MFRLKWASREPCGDEQYSVSSACWLSCFTGLQPVLFHSCNISTSSCLHSVGGTCLQSPRKSLKVCEQGLPKWGWWDKEICCNGGEKNKRKARGKEQMVREWWRQKPGKRNDRRRRRGNKSLRHGEIKMGSSRIRNAKQIKWKVAKNSRAAKWERQPIVRKMRDKNGEKRLCDWLLAVPNVSPDVPRCRLSSSKMTPH